jgi:hypothetical protein
LPQVDTVTLERRISVERLKPYRDVTNNDLSRAIALYEWNAKIAASFWLLLGHLEVVVRNAMHEQLTDWSTSSHAQQPWYRIAHHEPIHNRPLEQMHADVHLVSGWICPTACMWISSHSEVNAILSVRPS